MYVHETILLVAQVGRSMPYCVQYNRGWAAQRNSGAANKQAGAPQGD